MSKRYQYSDGGRAKAGFKGVVSDCAVRAIAIATKLPYKEAYDMVNKHAASPQAFVHKSTGKKSGARTGVFRKDMDAIMTSLGWKWLATMKVGQGCKVHLKKEDLPSGRLICMVTKHYVAVIDGVVHDSHDSTRNGTRCVYGYYYKD